MALHQTGMKVGMAVLLFFQLCGWVVSLGGTAHATNECRENTDEWKSPSVKPIGEWYHLQPFPSADESRAYDCGAWLRGCAWMSILGPKRMRNVVLGRGTRAVKIDVLSEVKACLCPRPLSPATPSRDMFSPLFISLIILDEHLIPQVSTSPWTGGLSRSRCVKPRFRRDSPKTRCA